MKHLLRLALAADAVALLTLMLGSWTRINGAGLTCPDWPLCHGRFLPSMGDGTFGNGRTACSHPRWRRW